MRARLALSIGTGYEIAPTSANNLLAPRASLLDDTTFDARADVGALANGLQPSKPGIWSLSSEEAA